MARPRLAGQDRALLFGLVAGLILGLVAGSKGLSFLPIVLFLALVVGGAYGLLRATRSARSVIPVVSHEAADST